MTSSQLLFRRLGAARMVGDPSIHLILDNHSAHISRRIGDRPRFSVLATLLMRPPVPAGSTQSLVFTLTSPIAPRAFLRRLRLDAAGFDRLARWPSGLARDYAAAELGGDLVPETRRA